MVSEVDRRGSSNTGDVGARVDGCKLQRSRRKCKITCRVDAHQLSDDSPERLLQTR
jgi:hypothetical protein